MSYAMSLALQTAVFARLSRTEALVSGMGAAVFDALPPGDVPDLYLALGAEKVRDASDAGGQGTIHDFTLSVVSTAAGFASAKQAAAIAIDALTGHALTLSRGRALALRFHRAAAARVGTGDTRRIDLTFRARLTDD